MLMFTVFMYLATVAFCLSSWISFTWLSSKDLFLKLFSRINLDSNSTGFGAFLDHPTSPFAINYTEYVKGTIKHMAATCINKFPISNRQCLIRILFCELTMNLPGHSWMLQLPVTFERPVHPFFHPPLLPLSSQGDLLHKIYHIFLLAKHPIHTQLQFRIFF